MSMLDAFFNKGFKGAKCKTLLKLTIPRIKLLRNRREVQIKQMRKDIAKLLEAGQEATARIRVEHIIREENMMAAQEIIELFCELIAVRLPIIEAQRECPLDLKEAISSVCFAAPRCADLPELQQVQMLFATKYGKEFVSAATELMPDCGVNRQLIELLSIRAPPAEAKLKLLKEIAEEHELDWDPTASQTELFKTHEDLLNGPTQFASGSKLPLPKEKHDESLYSASTEALDQQSDSDTGFDTLDLPEVPKVPLRPSADTTAPELVPRSGSSSPDSVNVSGLGKHSENDHEVTKYSGVDHELAKHSGTNENPFHESHMEPEEVVREPPVASPANISTGTGEEKQFLPFITPPSLSSASFSSRQCNPAPSLSKTKSEASFDLEDVLAAAQAAAETAERAAAAARSAASLAQVRITELIKKRNDQASEKDELEIDNQNQSAGVGMPQFDHRQSFGDTDGASYSLDSHPENGSNERGFEPPSSDQINEHESTRHQPQRLPSMEDDPYFSYPNLFTSQESNLGSSIYTIGNSRTTH
uniref:IST1 homolog n=1 Tax=Nelumbo nucifera TaxID=4432 RepID=A0A822XWS4_NELNU|nr:TPA_asm: hypothetical protein HUJ06_023301 [Nelumbo nucifera]